MEYLRWAAHHLADAGQINSLNRLLTRMKWLKYRINKDDVNALITDFQRSDDNGLLLVGESLSLASHVLLNDPDQLGPQLRARLEGRFHGAIEALLAGDTIQSPWIRPLRTGLQKPGNPLIRTYSGHSSAVFCVAVSPDVKWALSGSHDRSAILWELATGQPLMTFSDHGGGILAAAFMPDGRQVITGSSDRKVRLWDLHSGTLKWEMGGHQVSIRLVVPSPSGNTVLSLGDDLILNEWDGDKGHLINSYELPPQNGARYSYLSNGEIIITGKRIDRWNKKDGGTTVTLLDNGPLARFFTANIDLTRAISGHSDGRCMLWDLQLQQVIATFQAEDSIRAGCFLGVEHAVFATSGNLLIRWNLSTFNVDLQCSSFARLTEIKALDGYRFLSAGYDRSVRLWDMRLGARDIDLQHHQAPINHVALDQEGHFLLSASMDKTWKKWQVSNGELLQSVDLKDYVGGGCLCPQKRGRSDRNIWWISDALGG